MIAGSPLHDAVAVLAVTAVVVASGAMLAVATLVPVVLARRAARSGEGPIATDPAMVALLAGHDEHLAGLGDARDDDVAAARARRSHVTVSPTSPQALDGLVHPGDLAELEATFAAVHLEVAGHAAGGAPGRAPGAGELDRLCARRAVVLAVEGGAGELVLVLDDGSRLVLGGGPGQPEGTEDLVWALALGRVRLVGARRDGGRWQLTLLGVAGLVGVTADGVQLG